MPDTFPPSQVATMLSKSPTTIRRLTSQYAEALSPAANPPKGQARRYTREDIALLHAAIGAQDAGMPQDSIASQLATITLPPELPALPQPHQASQAGPGNALALLPVLESLTAQLDATQRLESRVGDMEAQRQRLVLLVTVALVVALVAVVLAFIAIVALVVR
jgi:DNA-binding transcriptional MerR regulator